MKRWGVDTAIRSIVRSVKFEGAGVKLIIPPMQRDKLVVIAAFDDFTVFENANHVGVADGGKTVRDDENRTSLHKFVHALFDEFLGASVD